MILRMIVGASSLGLCALTLSPPATAQGVGFIPYIEQSLEAIDYEFTSVGVRRTWDYRIQTLGDDRYRDFTFRLTEAGYIAVGSDTDTRRISIAQLEDGRPDGWNRDSGTRSANLYFNRAGTYTVRVHIEDCIESSCFYAVMTGYR